MFEMATKIATATALVFAAQVALAQSTVGEVLDKGGMKLSKADISSMMPYVVKFRWPQGTGEGEHTYKPDGTLSGSEYHYPSKSESPAEGTWTLDENGKICVKKSLSAWNTKAEACWFSFRLGDEYFMALQDADRAAKVFQLKSFVKLQ